jgi:hypothetical protein
MNPSKAKDVTLFNTAVGIPLYALTMMPSRKAPEVIESVYDICLISSPRFSLFQWNIAALKLFTGNGPGTVAIEALPDSVRIALVEMISLF